MAVVGQRRSWWRRQRGRGGVLYSREGHCGGGGARWWPKAALDGESTSAGAEEGGQLDTSTIPYRGRWLWVVAGLAPRHTRAVLSCRRSALGAEERGERQSGVG
jgi:hypothetical protein